MSNKAKSKKYIKTPIMIKAIQWRGQGGNTEEIMNFTCGRCIPCGDFLIIETLEGDMKARGGDYIIKGINGEFYPCKPDIFEKTYSEATK